MKLAASKPLTSPTELTAAELQAFAQATSLDALSEAASADPAVAGMKDGASTRESARENLARSTKSKSAKAAAA